MNNKIKYLLITLGVLGATIATYFAVKYYKIKKAYSNVLSESQAVQLIKTRQIVLMKMILIMMKLIGNLELLMTKKKQV